MSASTPPTTDRRLPNCSVGSWRKRFARFPARVLAACSLALIGAPGADAGIVLPPTTYTVGPGGGPPCDFSNIQDAIDAAVSGDTIRVVGNVNWITNLQIANKSLSLIGGYSDCADTTPDPGQRSTVSGLIADSTLTVSNAIAGVPTVLVRNFTVRFGSGGANKGGNIDVSGGLLLRLDNVNVQEGQADNGGGIRIHGGPPSPTLRLEGGTRVGGVALFMDHNNASQSGGGIYCDSGGAIEWVDASINYNTAQSGGGIYMNACTLSMPGAAGDGFRAVEIRGNQTGGSGGGVQALNGSSLTMNSAANRQVRISNNQAGGGGGGMYLLASSLDAQGLQIEENMAETGGGVYISGGSLNLNRGGPNGGNCPTAERCATVIRNLATGQAGAAYVSGGTTVDLRQVFVENNSANNMPGMLVTGSSTLILRDVQLAGNTGLLGGAELIFSSASTLQFRHVTVAFNDLDEVIRTISASSVTIHDSILWQPDIDTLVGDGSAVLDLSCNNAAESATIPGAATHTPGFLDGDGVIVPPPILRLAPDSANVDACDDAPAPNPAFDAIGQPRVIDATDVVNQAGPLDRGALEYQPPVFADGFEDG